MKIFFCSDFYVQGDFFCAKVGFYKFFSGDFIIILTMLV